MKQNKYIWLAIWAGMYVLCAVLGFLPPQEGANQALLVIMALLFFLPPALVIYRSWLDQDKKMLRLLRLVALVVLIATVTVLVINLLSVALILVMPESAALIVGDILYYLLILVSNPMICGQYWGIGLVGWAVPLWSTIYALKALKKDEK